MNKKVLNTIVNFLEKCQEDRRQKMISFGYLQDHEPYTSEKWEDFREKWFRGDYDDTEV